MNLSKKIFSVFVAVAIASMVLFTDMLKSVNEVSAYFIAESGTCGENLTWELDDEGTLTISGSGEMYDYGHGGSPFCNRNDIKEVCVLSGVISIGRRAFYKCTELQNITIYNSMCIICGDASTICNDYSYESTDYNYVYNGIIRSYNDSLAQVYAKECGYSFEILNRANYEIIYGDANGDGRVGIEDCAHIYSEIINGHKDVLPLSADFNCDDIIDKKDVDDILHHILFENPQYTYPIKYENALDIPNYITVSIDSCQASSGEKVSIPIGEVSSDTLKAFELSITYDKKLKDLQLSFAEGLIGNYKLYEQENDNLIHLAAYSSKPIKDGNIIELSFVVPANAKTNDEYLINIARIDSFYYVDNYSDGNLYPDISEKIFVANEQCNTTTTTTTPTETTATTVSVIDALETTTTSATDSSTTTTVTTTTAGAAETTTVSTTVTTESQTTTTNVPDSTEAVSGDANGDDVLNIRDAAYIAKKVAQGKTSELPMSADFNMDGKVNIRDAAAIAKYLVKK